MSDAKKILHFIKYAEGLKNEMRHASKSNGMRESVAEHSWNLALILLLVRPYLKIDFDLERALKMAVVHDLGEIDSGDISRLVHTGVEDIRAKKYEDEKIAMQKISEVAGVFGQEIYELWCDFESVGSNEAKIVKALDAFEGQYQFLSDPVTEFKKSDSSQVGKIIAETSKLMEVDSFLKEMDEATLPDLRKRAIV
jgi:putative hydrolase of HD superfamily